ncbi:MAG: hypothetical protein U0325_24880 [Polyangiales bacterium]
MSHRRIVRIALTPVTVLLAWLACPARVAHAQQAIVTMPSADITGPRQLFFMHESQLRPWGGRPYWAGTYFLTYGLGYGTELAATVFDQGVYPNGGTGNTSLALGFKSAVRLFSREAPTWQLQLTFGAMAVTSLNDGSVGGWIYALHSLRLPALRTRLAVGVSYATEQLYGPGVREFSLIASIEQPLPIPGVRGLSFVAEWFSGQHELSNFIFGLTWHPNPTWIFVLGWKIPTRYNTVDVNDMAAVAEVGFFLPPFGGRRPEERSVFDDDHDDHDPAAGPTPHPRAPSASARDPGQREPH